MWVVNANYCSCASLYQPKQKARRVAGDQRHPHPQDNYCIFQFFALYNRIAIKFSRQWIFGMSYQYYAVDIDELYIFELGISNHSVRIYVTFDIFLSPSSSFNLSSSCLILTSISFFSFQILASLYFISLFSCSASAVLFFCFYNSFFKYVFYNQSQSILSEALLTVSMGFMHISYFYFKLSSFSETVFYSYSPFSCNETQVLSTLNGYVAICQFQSMIQWNWSLIFFVDCKSSQIFSRCASCGESLAFSTISWHLVVRVLNSLKIGASLGSMYRMRMGLDVRQLICGRFGIFCEAYSSYFEIL